MMARSYLILKTLSKSSIWLSVFAEYITSTFPNLEIFFDNLISQYSGKKEIKKETEYGLKKFSTYVRFADRVKDSKKKLYEIFKNIKKTERLNFDRGDYPIPSSWKNTFKESLKFPSTYYGVGYEFD